MRRIVVASLTGVVALGGMGAAASGRAQEPAEQEYVVLYRSGVSTASGAAAVRTAGGRVVRENAAVGLATVTASNPAFPSRAAASAAVEGVARSRPIGYAPGRARPVREEVERERAPVPPDALTRRARPAPTPPSADPLAPLQWDMAMIHATATESYAVQPGDKRVKVGIIDTGIDGSHPDIAPNFDRALSRNFTTDIPLVDGPCQEEPDQSCSDPPDVDENGHGTHVAGIIGAPLNGLGIAGVAPNVTLVNVRAGQDSGFFFLQPTVDALTYAGDQGIDVVNMSFFTDPWLYNCAANPADSPAEQLEQRTIIAATQRALDYADAHGVTLVAALGNEHTDLGHPTTDTISPDFPPGTEKTRTVDDSCLEMPTEGRHVIGVSALGPSARKADYSNYGLEQTDVSAPGGWFRDGLGTPSFRTPENEILSAYPVNVALAVGDIDETGEPTTPFVIRDCANGACAYYQYLQGTSMAAPHASGVAAIIVSRFGRAEPRGGGGLTLDPTTTAGILKQTATHHPCPEPRLMTYTDVGRPPAFDAFCEGGPTFNGFYGHGIVDALGAATGRPSVRRAR